MCPGTALLRVDTEHNLVTYATEVRQSLTQALASQVQNIRHIGGRVVSLGLNNAGTPGALVAGSTDIMASQEQPPGDEAAPPSQALRTLKLTYAPPTAPVLAVGDMGPGFYDWRQVFPFLEPILELTAELAAEAKATPWWYEWPEKSLYKAEDGMDWKVRCFTCRPCPSHVILSPDAAGDALLPHIPSKRTRQAAMG